MALELDVVLRLADGRNLTVAALACQKIYPPGDPCPLHAVVEVDIDGDPIHCVENDFDALRQVLIDAHESAHAKGRN